MLLFIADFFQNADTSAMLTIMQKTFQRDVASCKSTKATSQCPSSLKEGCQGQGIFKKVEQNQRCA